MKQFWISLALLGVMLGAALGNSLYVSRLSESITERLEGAEEMARRGAWEQVDTITRQCFSDWSDNHAYLHIVSRHADTDEILISFRSVMEYTRLEELDQYVAENRALITEIELLAEMEQPDWLNVL